MQPAALDPRLMEIGIEINGRMKLYNQDLSLYASGTKFGNSNQNECTVQLFNLDKATQDYLVSESSPWNQNKTPKRLVVKAGRVSYGLSTIFTGNIITAKPGQRPDIGTSIRALTSNFQKGSIVSRTQPGITPLSKIAAGIASDLGLPLNFQAQDRQIANYNFSGAVPKQVDRLSEMGNINAYVDEGSLVVKDNLAPLTGRTRILNVNTGLIGDPETTELGIRATFLLDNSTVLGGGLRLESVKSPALNGLYVIYKLSFDISSRDKPFYWIAEARRRQ